MITTKEEEGEGGGGQQQQNGRKFWNSHTVCKCGWKRVAFRALYT
jgi:hypothetical protein